MADKKKDYTPTPDELKSLTHWNNAQNNRLSELNRLREQDRLYRQNRLFRENKLFMDYFTQRQTIHEQYGPASKKCPFPIKTNLHDIWCLSNPKTLTAAFWYMAKQYRRAAKRLSECEAQIGDTRILSSSEYAGMAPSLLFVDDPCSDKE